MNLLYLRWSIWTGLPWSISSGFRWSILSGESGQFVPAYYGQFHWNLHVPISAIIGIAVQNDAMQTLVNQRLLEVNLKIPVKIKPEFYF